MKQIDGRIVLAATDLSNHLGCPLITRLDHEVALGVRSKPDWRDPMLDVLAQRGQEHEDAYVQQLRAEGRTVEVMAGGGNEATVAAMTAGADVIVQPDLSGDGFRGRADVLLKVEGASRFGDWAYEVVDAKLSRETRGGAVLQLCLYSDILGALQGSAPSRMHIAKPGGAGIEVETFLCSDFDAYYRAVRSRLVAAVAAPDADLYPEPVEQCEVCKWWSACDRRRREDDHLSFVAGIQRHQRAELVAAGIVTLGALGEAGSPVVERPRRGTVESLERLRQQARVQLQGRREDRLIHELLPTEEGSGLLLLPAPSPGDVFFDIESDRFLDDGGREYLLGVSYRDGAGEPTYEAFWGLDRKGEKRAFERFIDLVTARWEADPGMHVYHFHTYEQSAIRRLVLRHATREREVDALLRGERLVDLHAVARKGVRASVERYGLKELERFAGFERAFDLKLAGPALRTIERHLEVGNPPELTPEMIADVEAYNRDDCLGTEALRGWLEERRAELPGASELPRPELEDGEASDGADAARKTLDDVADALRARLPEDPDDWTPHDQAHHLLASLVGYFDREQKCAWWEYFRLVEMDVDDVRDEPSAIAGLELIGQVGQTRTGIPIHRYRFPEQEIRIKRGATVKPLGEDDKLGEVEALDLRAGTVDIKKTKKTPGEHPTDVYAHDTVPQQPVQESLIALGQWVADHGIDAPGPRRAARDLLLRRPPRLTTPRVGPLRSPDEDLVDAARRLVRDLDHGVLAVQGPPGTGKTWLGSRVIVDLVRRGHKVGVTAVGHRVIRQLLEKSLAFSREDGGAPIEAAHQGGRKTDLPMGLGVTGHKTESLAALADGKLVGGTAWLWSADALEDQLDYLFVDEAGQLSLAHVLAAARATKNLVLLGDPQQLQQPQKGEHPDGSDQAALVHLLDGRHTVPPELGLFLDRTFRLHPDICRLTSELFYDGLLTSNPGLENQAILGAADLPGTGLAWIPVEHEGNQASSREEAAAVAGIIERLLSDGCEYRSADGASSRLGAADVMVVAPYNAQVALLQSRVPEGVRVGTVDRFQGGEAPVVIYSMAASSVEDAPRGMTFLHDLHRFNVATSRAKALFILVASRGVVAPDCRTPANMRRANALCRYLELASECPPPRTLDS